MTYDDWMLVATAASPVVAAVAGALTIWAWWTRKRAAELRLNDVLPWALRTIDTLQSIVLVIRHGRHDTSAALFTEKATALLFESSTLIEQGRLYFKNEPSPHGANKHEAYRGLRPRVLDPVVAGYEALCEWRASNGRQDHELLLIATDAEQRFVSLIVQEVGRSRAAFARAANGGKGIHLEYLLQCKSKTDFDAVYN